MRERALWGSSRSLGLARPCVASRDVAGHATPRGVSRSLAAALVETRKSSRSPASAGGQEGGQTAASGRADGRPMGGRRLANPIQDEQSRRATPLLAREGGGSGSKTCCRPPRRGTCCRTAGKPTRTHSYRSTGSPPRGSTGTPGNSPRSRSNAWGPTWPRRPSCPARDLRPATQREPLGPSLHHNTRHNLMLPEGCVHKLEVALRCRRTEPLGGHRWSICVEFRRLSHGIVSIPCRLRVEWVPAK